ncbi:MAG: DNA polymerase III subunit delta' C-terminal domain-containing protein, partial [Acidobacteriota bacterium]
RYEDLVGQTAALRFLRKALRKGVLPQVLLFSGPRGIGKATAAVMTAAGLLCEKENQGPCGECLPCRKVSRGIHPDVREVGLELVEETGKTRTQIVLEQVRTQVLQPLALPPYEGRRLVLLLDPAEALNVNSQNALLKSLEEPPPYAQFILIASNVSSLLPTVRSRCHEVVFSSLTPDEMRAYCKRTGLEGVGEPALAAAGGSPGQLLALGGGEGAARREALLRLLAEGLSLTSYTSLFPLLGDLAKDDPREVVSMALGLVRDAQRISSGGEPLRHRDVVEHLSSALAARGAAGLDEVAERLAQAPSQLARNANPRLLLERLFLVP